MHSSWWYAGWVVVYQQTHKSDHLFPWNSPVPSWYFWPNSFWAYDHSSVRLFGICSNQERVQGLLYQSRDVRSWTNHTKHTCRKRSACIWPWANNLRYDPQPQQSRYGDISCRFEALRCQPEEGLEQTLLLCKEDACGKCPAAVSGGASVSNAMSLKAKIRNIAKQKNIPVQVMLQNYMFESRSKRSARLIGI